MGCLIKHAKFLESELNPPIPRRPIRNNSTQLVLTVTSRDSQDFLIPRACMVRVSSSHARVQHYRFPAFELFNTISKTSVTYKNDLKPFLEYTFAGTS